MKVGSLLSTLQGASCSVRSTTFKTLTHSLVCMALMCITVMYILSNYTILFRCVKITQTMIVCAIFITNQFDFCLRPKKHSGLSSDQIDAAMRVYYYYYYYWFFLRPCFI